MSMMVDVNLLRSLRLAFVTIHMLAVIRLRSALNATSVLNSEGALVDSGKDPESKWYMLH